MARVKGFSAALALALLASSCAHQKVNREALLGVKRIGIVAVVIDRLAPQPSDEAVLRATADRGAQQAAELLARRVEWQVVPHAQFRDHPAYRALLEGPPPRPAETRNEDVKAALLTLLKGGPQRDAMIAGNLLADLPRRSGAKYVAASGMPVLPYAAFDSSGGGSGGFTTQSGPRPEYDPEIRESLRASLGQLAQQLGLDAVAVVYLKTAVHATVGVGVIVGDRGMDTIRMKPTLIAVAKDGTAIVDLGAQSIDSLTTGRSAVPVYAAVRQPKGGHTQVLDLGERTGKVQREFLALVDEAMPGLAERFTKALATP